MLTRIGIDADDMIQWEDDEDWRKFSIKKPSMSKRTRQASVLSDGRGSTGSEYSDRAGPKRLKREPEQKSPRQDADLASQMLSIDIMNASRSNRNTAFQPQTESYLDDTWPTAAQPVATNNRRGMTSKIETDERAWAGPSDMDYRFSEQLQIPHPVGFTSGPPTTYSASDYGTCSQAGSPLTTSFGSDQSGQDSRWNRNQASDAPNAFTGRPNFAFEQSQNGNKVVQVYRAADIPQPQFDTVPNTPLYSPVNGIHFPEVKIESELTDSPYGACGPSATTSTPSYQLLGAGIQDEQLAAHINSARYMPNTFHGNDGNDRYHDGALMGQSQPPSHQYSQAASHGLPFAPYYRQPTHGESDPSIPFSYPETKPDTDFPAAPLPGWIVRGFTGHSSGVGKSLRVRGGSVCNSLTIRVSQAVTLGRSCLQATISRLTKRRYGPLFSRPNDRLPTPCFQPLGLR